MRANEEEVEGEICEVKRNEEEDVWFGLLFSLDFIIIILYYVQPGQVGSTRQSDTKTYFSIFLIQSKST